MVLVVIGSTRHEEDRRLLQSLRDEAIALGLNQTPPLPSSGPSDSVIFVVDQVY